MKVIQAVVFFCAFLPLQTTAQTAAIDSLQQLLAVSRTVGEKAFVLYEITDLQSELDSALAYKTLRKNRELIEADRYLQAFDPYYEAQIIWMSDSARTKKLYQKAIQLLQPYKTVKAVQITARAWHNFGIFSQISGRQDEFTSILLHKVIPLSRQINDMLSVASAYNALGTVYNNKEDYGTALTYFIQGIGFARSGPESLKKTMILADAYIASSRCMIHLGKDPAGIKDYLDHAEQLLGEVGDPVYHADYYLNLGKYYEVLHDYKNAVIQFDNGLVYAEKTPTVLISTVMLTYEKAYALMQLKKYNESKALLDSLLARSASDFSVNNRAYALKLRSEVEAHLGQFPAAYGSLKQWGILSDSLHTVQETAKIAEIKLKYDISAQENQILKLENANRRNLFFIVIFVLFLLLSGVVFFIALSNRKKQNRQQFKLLSTEKEIAIKDALISGEEQERMRLARELHDGLGGTFSGIKLKLENAIKKQDLPEISRSVELLNNAISEFRQTTHRLVPEHLKRNGLESNVRDFCHSFQASGINFQFYFKGVGLLNNQEKELIIFRIIQELITNAVKHSGAGTILLNCVLENQLLLLTIEDNGIGLRNIETRIKMMNGAMQIESGKGSGTVINIEIVI